MRLTRAAGSAVLLLSLMVWTTVAEAAPRERLAPDQAFVQSLFNHIPPGLQLPEAARMFLVLAAGGRMGGDSGWFGPSQSLYTWERLAQRHGIDPARGIPRARFLGSPEAFRVLDRDRNGLLTAADLDWSATSPLSLAGARAKALFRMIDDGDGRVTPEEWQALYRKLSGDKGYLALDDLLPILLERKTPTRGPGKKGNAKQAEKMRWAMIKGFMDGDVGSWCEGPSVGERAPNFTRPTVDGSAKINLADSFGKRPVVLIFGSFT